MNPRDCIHWNRELQQYGYYLEDGTWIRAEKPQYSDA